MTIKQRAEIARQIEEASGHLWVGESLFEIANPPMEFKKAWLEAHKAVQVCMQKAYYLPVLDAQAEPSPKPPTYTGD